MAIPEPFVLVPEPREPPARWLHLRGCTRILESRDAADAPALLDEVERETAAGRIAAGFVSYDASSAFDPALKTRPAAGSLPVIWFAVFERAEPFDVSGFGDAAPAQLDWHPAIDRTAHAASVAAIHAAIARGETYQVNFTFPLEAPFAGRPADLFARLLALQRGDCGAFIETARFAVCSASPELFFALEEDRLVCRPMKGTAARGRWTAEDDAAAEALRHSVKDRAENLMIVDMVRNDLGRIARTGTVEAGQLFAIERYPTVHQMTSTVGARTDAGLADLFRALFPSASITGAPKVQTSRLIAGLEANPRGVYTGAIGVVGPGRRARFNVAIRTAVVDRVAGRAIYGTGSGVVWDSKASSEFDECLAKARALETPPPEFDLLETMRWERTAGFVLLDGHLDRLKGSARYFGRPCRPEDVRSALTDASSAWTDDARRVRLTLSKSGAIGITSTPLAGRACFADRPSDDIPGLRAALVPSAVDPQDIFLHHKTTQRAVYAAARAARADVDESILLNEAGEVTEGTIGNVVAVIDGVWTTPPREAGLLGGVFREALIRKCALVERPLPLAAFKAATQLFLINSVRGWCRLAVHMA